LLSLLILHVVQVYSTCIVSVCSVFSEVFITEEVDGVGSGGQEIPLLHKMLLEAFSYMSPGSACFIHEAFFSGKNKTFCLETTFLKLFSGGGGTKISCVETAFPKCWIIGIFR